MAAVSRENSSETKRRVVEDILRIEGPGASFELSGLLQERLLRSPAQVDRAVQEVIAQIERSKSRPEESSAWAHGGTEIFYQYNAEQGVTWYERVVSGIARKDRVVCSYGENQAQKIVDQILKVESARNRLELPHHLKAMVKDILINRQEADFVGKLYRFLHLDHLSEGMVEFFCNPEGEITGYQSEKRRYGTARERWPNLEPIHACVLGGHRVEPFAARVIYHIIEIEKSEKVSQLDRTVRSLLERMAHWPKTDYDWLLGWGFGRHLLKVGFAETDFSENTRIFISIGEAGEVTWYERLARSSVLHKYQIVCSYGEPAAKNTVSQLLQIEGVKDRTELPISVQKVVDQIVTQCRDRDFPSHVLRCYNTSTDDNVAFVCDASGTIMGYRRGKKLYGVPAKHWGGYKSSEHAEIEIYLGSPL